MLGKRLCHFRPGGHNTEIYGINLWLLPTFWMIMMQPLCYGILFSTIKSYIWQNQKYINVVLVDKPQPAKLNFCEACWLRITNASINLQKSILPRVKWFCFRSWVCIFGAGLVFGCFALSNVHCLMRHVHLSHLCNLSKFSCPTFRDFSVVASYSKILCDWCSFVKYSIYIALVYVTGF